MERRAWQDVLEARVKDGLILEREDLALDDTIPFDLEEALALYQSTAPSRRQAHHTWKEDKWRRAWLKKGSISTDEARFWFFVGTDPKRLEEPRGEQWLRVSWHDFTLDIDVCIGRLRAFATAFAERYGSMNALYTQSYLGPLLEAVMPVDDAIRVLYEGTSLGSMVGFLKRMSGRTRDEKAEKRLGEYLRGKLVKGFNLIAAEDQKAKLALVTRAHDPELSRACIQHINQTRRSDLINAQTFSVLAALDDRDLLTHTIKVNKPRWTPTLTQLWFARNGLEHIDVVEKGIIALDDEDLMNAALEVLEGIEEPELARVMLPVTSGKVAPRRALEWFSSCDRTGLDFLVAESRARGKRAERAMRVILWIQEHGGREELEEVLAEAPDSVRERAEMLALVKHGQDLEVADVADLPQWLLDIARKRKPKGWPRAMDLETLAPLQIAGTDTCLPQPHYHGILQELMAHNLSAPLSAPLTNARTFLDEKSQERFVLSLLDEWQVAGEPTRHRWSLEAARVFGGERVLQRLGADVDVLYGERKYKAVDRILEILNRSEHPQGLIELQRLSQRSKFKRVRANCATAVQRLASRKGWDMERFTDHTIPTGGLDEHEEVVFDYGPRSFTLAILADGSLVLREDGSSEVHTSLPRKRKTDDKAMVAQAKVDWAARKKQLGDVIKVQVERLRLALTSARRWDSQGWEELLGHPIMKHLLCGLLWGIYDKKNKLQACFRVADDQSLANLEDEEFTLVHGEHKIGIVHPLELDEEDTLAWSALFAEYEIIQPVHQLHRKTFRLDKEERKALDLTRLAGLLIEDSGWLRGHLRRNRWTNKSRGRDILITGLQRVFPMHGITAHLYLSPGFDPVTSKNDLPQRVSWVHFSREDRRVPLERVPEVVISEVLLDFDPFVRAAENSQ